MTVAALSTQVQIRLSDELLKQLTNTDSTATSINTTRLEAACADAIGEFERIAQVAHDMNVAAHVSVLVTGVMFFLESYKSREGAMTTAHMKRFYSGCENFKKLLRVPPTTNSNLTVTRETSGTTPDMDRRKMLWNPSGQIPSPQATADFSE